MPYKLCDASELKPGHLGLMTFPSVGNRFVFPARSVDTHFVVILPKDERNSTFDFRLYRVGISKIKVLDLGPEHYFDVDPGQAALIHSDIRRDAGSLLVVGSDLVLMAVLGREQATFDGDMQAVAVQKGKLAAFGYDDGCEFKSWRLFIPSAVPHEPAKLIATWPPAAASTTNISALRL